MRVNTARNSGFSLIEAMFAVIFSVTLVGFGVIYLGRKLVDNDDPIRTAKAAGYIQAVVLTRSNFSSPYSVCGANSVTFKLSVWRKENVASVMQICCPAWFGPCEIKK